ncbi:MAG: hypothetical protein ABIR54_04080 [Burkholderiaceae bacterium]
MSTGSHQPHGYSKACWRCQHWGDFAHGRATHSLCKHPKSSPVQASPANGCACWSLGEGDTKPADWVPVGFKSAIGREEMNQADGYIQDFLNSGALDGTPVFRAAAASRAARNAWAALNSSRV